MIKRVNILTVIIMLAGCLSAVMAQDAPTVSTPSISDNASPLDNNIKMRSVELDRIAREAEKTAVIRRDNGKVLNFSLIKDDFEGMQLKQAEIINAYTVGEVIDYKKIAESANQLTEMAVRLRGNVIPPEAQTADDDTDKKKEDRFKGKSVRDLIVALDEAIGNVVTQPMWQKLAVIDSEASKAVDKGLVEIIDASNALWIEATKKTSK